MRSHYLLLPASLALLGSAPVFSQQDPLTLSAGYSVQTDSNLFRLPDGVYRTSADRNDYLPPPNPWTPGSFNLTKQLQIKREAPELSRHLAGTTQAPNPWAKGPSFNLTEQIRIKRENPGLAAELKAKAGTA